MKFLWFLFAGLLSGVLGGMGMGGGTVLIPLLSLFYSVDQHVAQGINLISFIPMAIVALVLHTKNKLVKYKTVIPCIIASVVFGIVGSIISKNVSASVLKRIFGGFLLLLSVVQFFSEKIAKKIRYDG